MGCHSILESRYATVQNVRSLIGWGFMVHSALFRSHVQSSNVRLIRWLKVLIVILPVVRYCRCSDVLARMNTCRDITTVPLCKQVIGYSLTLFQSSCTAARRSSSS